MLGAVSASAYLAYAVIGLVVVQRLSEMLIAGRNTRALKARGALEVGASHYPYIVALHAGWLAALTGWVAVWAPPINLPLLMFFAALQIARFWILFTLGPYWTTRIITLPGAPLVKRGPYRLLRHPNYAVVVMEVAVLPLVFGAWAIAAVFSLLNAAVLIVRVRAENRALAARSYV